MNVEKRSNVKKRSLYTTEGQVLPDRMGKIAVYGFIGVVAFIVFFEGVPFYTPISKILSAIWVIGPPIWFWYEHNHHFPNHRKEGSSYSDLKAEQDIAAKIWAAFIVILFALAPIKLNE